MLLHVLAEEQSAEPVIRRVASLVQPDIEVKFIYFRGKPALLRNLPNRLRGYATWPGQAW